MKYLEYKVQNMAISKASTDKTALISGATNYFGLSFDFDEEFSAVPGIKAVEFLKNKNKYRRELIDGACAIPNELLKDKQAFEMRVVVGTTIGTQWTSVAITESGTVLPEEPEEESPVGTEYVKTISGDEAAPYIKATTNGLLYSQNGEDWNSGVSGVPEVPSRPKDAAYLRKNGDWVNAEEYLSENGGDANAIEEIKVDNVPLEITDKSVNIDLTPYAKIEDVESTYAEKSTVESLQTLKGTAETISDIEYSVTDISDVISAYNTLLSALRERGVIL